MPLFLIKNIAIGILVSGAMFTNLFAPTTSESTIPLAFEHGKLDSITISQVSGPEPLDIWIENLIELESKGRADIRVLDVNGWYSYGCLQFQKPTFIGMAQGYGLLSDSDIENVDSFIYDCEFQKKLAIKILEGDPDGWKHWYTSVAKRGLGLPPIEYTNDLAQAK